MKNSFRKMKKGGHFTLEFNGWRWEVMKVNKLGPRGTSFVKAYTPFCPNGEMGDIYNAELPGFDEAYAEAVSKLN
jgi:hypothetical protein